MNNLSKEEVLKLLEVKKRNVNTEEYRKIENGELLLFY